MPDRDSTVATNGDIREGFAITDRPDCRNIRIAPTFYTPSSHDRKNEAFFTYDEARKIRDWLINNLPKREHLDGDGIGEAEPYVDDHYFSMEKAIKLSRFRGTENITIPGAVMVLASAVLIGLGWICTAIETAKHHE